MDKSFIPYTNSDLDFSRKMPSLGFVGFYRSPYWAVMENQARFLEKLWSGDAQAEQTLEEDTTMEEMLSLRQDSRCAQFPMGDYAYLMESFSTILGMQRYEPSDPSLRTGKRLGNSPPSSEPPSFKTPVLTSKRRCVPCSVYIPKHRRNPDRNRVCVQLLFCLRCG
jgi:hypothetical protein